MDWVKISTKSFIKIKKKTVTLSVAISDQMETNLLIKVPKLTFK